MDTSSLLGMSGGGGGKVDEVQSISKREILEGDLGSYPYQANASSSGSMHNVLQKTGVSSQSPSRKYVLMVVTALSVFVFFGGFSTKTSINQFRWKERMDMEEKPQRLRASQAIQQVASAESNVNSSAIVLPGEKKKRLDVGGTDIQPALETTAGVAAGATVGGQLGGQLGSAAGEETGMKAGGDVGDAIGGAMGHEDVGRVIGGGVGTSVGGAVGGVVGATVGVVQGVRVGAEKGTDVDGIAHEVVKYMPSKNAKANMDANMINEHGKGYDSKSDDDTHDIKMHEPWEVQPAPSPAPASTDKKKHKMTSKSDSHKKDKTKKKKSSHEQKSKSQTKNKSKKYHSTAELVDTRDDHEIVEEDKKHMKETGVHHGENPTPPPAVGKDPVFYHGDELHKNKSDSSYMSLVSCVDEGKVDKNAVCAQDFAPVCGCNEVTYNNECEAESAGVSSWRSGQCTGDGETPPPPEMTPPASNSTTDLMTIPILKDLTGGDNDIPPSAGLRNAKRQSQDPLSNIPIINSIEKADEVNEPPSAGLRNTKKAADADPLTNTMGSIKTKIQSDPLMKLIPDVPLVKNSAKEDVKVTDMHEKESKSKVEIKNKEGKKGKKSEKSKKKE